MAILQQMEEETLEMNVVICGAAITSCAGARQSEALLSLGNGHGAFGL